VKYYRPPKNPPPEPNEARQRRRRSTLAPDDVAAFERAAESRPQMPSSGPPYDPGSEERVTVQRSRQPTVSKTQTKKMTRELTAVLQKKDPFRLRVMRGHLRWAAKFAAKNGIRTEEVDPWLL
jgi:hypothetical protein